MDINNVVENIIKIPTEFYKLRNISIYELFNKSKYCDYYNYITENDIRNYLLNNRNYVKDWFVYSDEQRTGKGYYVVLENEKYEVGYYDGKKRNIINTYNLSQDIDACANFIKLELEYQRQNDEYMKSNKWKYKITKIIIWLLIIFIPLLFLFILLKLIL